MSGPLERVWVVQCKSTGHFLSPELHMVRSLRLAGRAPDLECAIETGRIHFGMDFEVFSFFEPVEVSDAVSHAKHF